MKFYKLVQIQETFEYLEVKTELGYYLNKEKAEHEAQRRHTILNYNGRHPHHTFRVDEIEVIE